MTKLLALGFVVALPLAAFGHEPNRRHQVVRPRVDVIGPVGNRLPPEHRRVYNRPTYVGGKIAYWIAPSSQEAMAWHRAEHAGLYNGKRNGRYCPRMEQHFFYPKPWEAIRIGARPDPNADKNRKSLSKMATQMSDDEDDSATIDNVTLDSDTADKTDSDESKSGKTEAEPLPAPGLSEPEPTTIDSLELPRTFTACGGPRRPIGSIEPLGLAKPVRLAWFR